jgi:predicted MPP superfamily phosphohydrolase
VIVIASAPYSFEDAMWEYGFPLAVWVGHACVWTYLLNNLYGRRLSKWFLKPWRLITGMAIVLGWPLLILLLRTQRNEGDLFATTPVERAIQIYGAVCLIIGGALFPLISFGRLLRLPPECVVETNQLTRNYRIHLGPAIIGRGKWWWLAKLPFTSIFTVDFTELTLRLPKLPKAWDGLTILHLTDLHFHGTPTKAFFEAILAETKSLWPMPDLVVLTGDYVDTDEHVSWIEPLLSTLTANEAKLAILGNHDEHHRPDRVREALAAAGYRVISNQWAEVTIRGERCAVVGHEGPWFGPPPGPCPWPGLPKLCLTHTPDNVYWAAGQGVALAFAGHVHGGQIRIPVIGPIFVPSIYSRRFDSGVFEIGKTTMVVSRGLSGKEPIRFRCHPQVIRVTMRTS